MESWTSSPEIKNRYICKYMQVFDLLSWAFFKLFLFNFIKIQMDIHNKFNDLNSIEKI